MGIVAKEVKAMTQQDILAFEEAGEVTIASHCLKLSDIKVCHVFFGQFVCDQNGLILLNYYICFMCKTLSIIMQQKLR